MAFKVLKREKRKPFSTVDIETAKSGDMLSGDIYNGAVHTPFFNWQEFIDLLSANKDKKEYRTLIAHFGGVFDWVSYLEYLVLTDYKYKIVMVSSAIIILQVEIDGKTFKFLDSGRVLLQALKKLGDVFKPKSGGKKEIDIDNIETIFKEDPDLYWEYLEGDTETLYDICIQFMDKLDINFFPVTISSLSMYLFRKRFLDDDLMQEWNKDIDEFITESYAGGRVECFKQGYHEKVYSYDINSLYPSIMRKKEVPYGKAIPTDTFIKEKLGFYRIKFKQENRKVPSVLWQKTNERGLEFVYEGEGVFFSEEIKEAIKQKTEIKIIEGYYFPRSKVLFKKFVDHFYELRKKNKGKSLDHISKIILNSLSGKFCERKTKEVLLKLTNNEVLQMVHAGKDLKLYRPEYCLYTLTEEREVPHRQVYIGSAITAYARLELYKYLKRGAKDIVYCDTDSVHLLKPLDKKYISDKIGAMKAEEKGEAYYLGRKQYYIDGKRKFKGIKTDDKLTGNKFTKEHYIEILKNGVTSYSFGSFPKLKSVLNGEKASKIKTFKKYLTKGKYCSNFKYEE